MPEILANVVESVAILVRALWRRRSRMGTSEQSSVLVVFRFGTSGLVLWTGTSGAYLVLLSPVVTTVAGEVTADVLMTSL
jgi:hypothetical protein